MPFEHSTTSSSSTKRKASRRSVILQKKPEPSEPCKVCGKRVSRTTDLKRHMQIHDPSAEKLPCPWEGCGYSTLQKSNLKTHYRRHKGDKPYICFDDLKCKFRTCDPASLIRHRKHLHGYMPGLGWLSESDGNRDKTGTGESSSSSTISSASGSTSESSSAILSSNLNGFPEMSQMTDTEILSLYEYEFIPSTSESIDSFYSPSESQFPIPGNPLPCISSLSDFFNFLAAEPDTELLVTQY